MSLRRFPVILLALASGCAGADLGEELVRTPPTPGAAETLQLVVTPTLDAVDASGAVRALPARVPSPPLGVRIAVDLTRPFPLFGEVVGVTPAPLLRAEIPGELAPVDATLHLRTPGLAETLRTTTDADGLFSVAVVAAPYDLTVVPDDPRLPITRFAIDPADGDEIALELGTGVPVYGRVTRGGAPYSGALVQAITAAGLPGAVATTDPDGWYQIQVEPGVFSIRTTGSGNGFDPTLAHPAQAIGEQGLRADFDYPAAPLQSVTARAIGPGGDGVAGLDFRLRSSSLPNHPDGAVVEILGTTDNRGNIVTQAVGGDYVLELLPSRDRDLTGLRVDGITVSGATALGDLRLAPTSTLSTRVVDDAGLPVAGAQVGCREVGLRGRSWAGFTNDAGHVELAVAAGLLSCAVQPPAARPDLALTRVNLTADAAPTAISMVRGEPIFGTVQFEGQPEAFAIVEVQDASGRIWASALTDSRGAFSLRVAFPQ